MPIDPASAHPELSVDAMIRLIKNAFPNPRAARLGLLAHVNEAHRVMAGKFADGLRPGRNAYPEERGTVIAGGGLKYFPNIWVCVNLIFYFGCKLPMQLWYLGDGDCDPYLKRLLKPLGVASVDGRKLEQKHPCRIVCGWELKAYATLHSPFVQVLFLDADNRPVRDVTYLFDSRRFGSAGPSSGPTTPAGGSSRTSGKSSAWTGWSNGPGRRSRPSPVGT